MEMPFITSNGMLVIPFGSPKRYHYWLFDTPEGKLNSSLPLIGVLEELHASREVKAKYFAQPTCNEYIRRKPNEY